MCTCNGEGEKDAQQADGHRSTSARIRNLSPLLEGIVVMDAKSASIAVVRSYRVSSG